MRTARQCLICGPTQSIRWYQGKCARCYKLEWRKRFPEKVKAQRTSWYARHPKYRAESSRRERVKNPEKCKSRSSKWARSHRAIVAAKSARYRANLLKAIPNWLTPEHWKQIRLIYQNCPSGMEVDHIVPLRGTTVSGLHVPWNLQYLSRSENAKKRNVFNPTSE